MKPIIETLGRVCAGLLIVALVADVADADTIVLSDGKKLEGSVTEDGDCYVIRSAGGVVTRVPRKDVAKWIRSESSLDVYERRLKKLEAGSGNKDADAWYELGVYAREIGLLDAANSAFDRAIELDTYHAKARLARGYKRAGGGWILMPSTPATPEKPRAQDTNVKPNPKPKPKPKPQPKPRSPVSPFRKKNWIHCPKCEGTRYEIWLTCIQCDGSPRPGFLDTGQYMIRCNRCKGRTKLPGLLCRHCRGAGKIDADNPPKPKKRRVPTGYMLCMGCGGSGSELWNQCTQCRTSKWKGLICLGDRLMICNRCKGEGRVPFARCSRCGGRGIVKD